MKRSSMWRRWAPGNIVELVAAGQALRQATGPERHARKWRCVVNEIAARRPTLL